MAKEQNAFSKAVQNAQSGLRIPAVKLVNSDMGMAAVLSKLVSPTLKPNYDSRGNREHLQPNMGMFKQMSEHATQSISDARTAMQTLPDMELAFQILISSILSPKDMTNVDPIYGVTEGLMSPEVTAAMLAVCADHFEHDYKIKPQLAEWLRDVIAETGSYALAVIPENSIDDAINGPGRVTLESLSESVQSDGSIKPVGMLGPVIPKAPKPFREVPGISLEAFDHSNADTDIDTRITFQLESDMRGSETFVSVIDNFDVLKMPMVQQRLREERIVERLGAATLRKHYFSNEAYDPQGPTNDTVTVFGQSGKKSPKDVTDRLMTSLIYKERQYTYKPIATLRTQEQLNRRSVGNPLVLHLPSESVIPVYVPGNMKEQVGFFVMIDGDGNPISKANNADYYQQISSQMNSNGSFPSAMLSRVKQMTGGFDQYNREHLDYSARAYGNMVEQDLLARLKNGVYGNGVALAKKEEIYRIMFARSLAKQHTQLLFVPTQLMTYIAFKFGAAGVGESVMEQMKVLNSLRSMLTFANVMASLKNSIGRTEVKFKLDPDDPDPQKTIEIGMHEIVRSRQHYFPLGMNSPTDLVDWLQKAGFEFTYEGHPGIPDTSILFGEKNTQYVKPDTELEDTLRKRAIMAIGLSPETVDATYQAEFATSIVRNNILMSKRVLQYQDQFTPQVSDHLRKYIMNSEKLREKLHETLLQNYDKLKHNDGELNKDMDGDAHRVEQHVDENHKKLYVIDKFLKAFINSFTMTLPQPSSVTLENQMAEMEIYAGALDKALDAYLGTDFITTETAGEVANDISLVKATLKAHFIRQFLNENGVLPELNVITAKGEDGKPAMSLYEVQADHIKNLGVTVGKFVQIIQKNREAADAKLKAAGVTPGGTPDTTSGSDDSSSSSDTGSGGDDDFGFGDFGSPDAGTGSDATPDEEPVEPETPTEEPAAPAEPEAAPAADTNKPAEGEKTDEEKKKEEEEKKKAEEEEKKKSSEGGGAQTPSA